MRPKLIDLFCGAGGAATGYHRAGFEVTGIDIAPQPNYPYAFTQADAMDIDWMTRAEITQAIPPAYTEHIGRHLMGALNLIPSNSRVLKPSIIK